MSLTLRSRKMPSSQKNLHKFFNRADVPWVELILEKHYINEKLPNHIKRGLSSGEITQCFFKPLKAFLSHNCILGIPLFSGMMLGMSNKHGKLPDIYYPYPNCPNPRYPILNSDSNFDYPKLVWVIWVVSPGTRTTRITQIFVYIFVFIMCY